MATPRTAPVTGWRFSEFRLGDTFGSKVKVTPEHLDQGR